MVSGTRTIISANHPERFCLELNLTGQWLPEKAFSNCGEAEVYGEDHFPSNDWRVWDHFEETVVAQQSALRGMMGDMRAELNRFQHASRWRNHFVNGAPRPVTPRPRPRPIPSQIPKKLGEQHVIDWIKEGF
jgi:hypothetical protein